jgi:hypothetical protein
MTKIWCQFWCQYFHHIGINQCNLLQLFCYKINCYKQIQTCVNLWKPSFDAHNQGVVGSFPTGPTSKSDSYTVKKCNYFYWCQFGARIWVKICLFWPILLHTPKQIQRRIYNSIFFIFNKEPCPKI